MPVPSLLRIGRRTVDKLREAARQALGALVRAEALYGQPNADIQTALREALAEPQTTTPDVCGEVCARAKLCYGCNKDLEEANAKYVEQAEQEPVGYFAYDEEHDIWEELTGPNAPGATPLYTAPVRTKDLTDDEIGILRQQYGITSDGRGIKEWVHVVDFARAVIAADREKNK